MNRELWEKIDSFDFDQEDADFSFSMRLARENGWSTLFTEKVIREYKRFLYLLAEAGHPVTPSEEVDQAWHLHLCYTESYWERLCRDTIGKPLHHGPTKGGQRESTKFHNWYQKTLDTYNETFGEEPPEDCWPPAHKRFAPDRRVWIDRADYFVISKRTLALFCAVAISLLVFTSCKSSTDTSFVTILIGFAVLSTIVSLIRKNGGGGNGSSGCGGCNGCGGCGGCGG